MTKDNNKKNGSNRNVMKINITSTSNKKQNDFSGNTATNDNKYDMKDEDELTEIRRKRP